MANELPPALLAEVDKALKDLAKAKELCRKGENCGFDLSGHQAVVQAVEERLVAVKREFGSGRRNDA